MKLKSTVKTYKVNSTEKHLIDYLVHCPEPKLYDCLVNFTEWPFEKNDDLNHWNDLLDRFEEIFQRLIQTYTPPKYVTSLSSSTSSTTLSSSTSSNSSTTSSSSSTTTTATTDQPTTQQSQHQQHVVYSPILLKPDHITEDQYNRDKSFLINILNFTKSLLYSCNSISIYHSSEELFQLLAFNDFEIVCGVLQVLNALLTNQKYVKENHTLLQTLLIPKVAMFSQGFSESHLDLLACCSETLELPKSIFNTTFEFYEPKPKFVNNNTSTTTTTTTTTSSDTFSSITTAPGGKVVISLHHIDRNEENNPWQANAVGRRLVCNLLSLPAGACNVVAQGTPKMGRDASFDCQPIVPANIDGRAACMAGVPRSVG
ncbi:hypothetical protein DFA_01822 [Cavenderia fasciculata]|uniref:DUF908 domain-containing protein n=1 Tax=Cavenderia fasciculata TaxID=261658 RepID=F4PUX4_CACFS|nr:uncharacterized protein DFA_01822 [Cavenderia fasciculata]EGG21936.1 hypothetical protein DFA_01822 [Cavenderia fasciculata]|eukprot:XP_004359787.1 hypothetical protein DFA_01822 [Cavenderia fasciculata]